MISCAVYAINAVRPVDVDLGGLLWWSVIQKFPSKIMD